MVKSMKKLSQYREVGDLILLTTISSVEHCCNTGAFVLAEMAYPQLEALKTSHPKHYTS